jgi:hypothetical protein
MRGTRSMMAVALLVTLGTLAAPGTPSATDAETASLGIPREVDGHPTDVGLLVLGHSTSDQGDYPQKLAQSLNANPSDGRNYQVFEVITGGDGGFLWSQARFAPNDPQFHRVAASQTGTQWCSDAAGNRWSVRRVRVDRALTGAADPTGGACGQTAPVPTTCTYHDASGPRTASGFRTCWQRMDVTLALLQDTTNRSWPVDDWTGDGSITGADRWPASRIPDAAEPCTNGRPGVVGTTVDWNCDGALTDADAAHRVYSGWLDRFATALLTAYGTDSVDHVFVTQKPLEFGATCPQYPAPERPSCSHHAIRTPTASRPFDHFYNPLVHWEWAAVQHLLTRPGVDPRIHPGESAPRRMHQRSQDCYATGITTWAIPATVPGRPTTITADDTEWNAGEQNADTIGCLRADHIHHTPAGGWLMADTWYQALTPHLV